MMQVKKIIKKYLNGVSVKDIAEELGVTREAVYRILRREPMFDVWVKTHFCMKHLDEIEIILNCDNLKELAKKFNTIPANALRKVKKLAKYDCIPYQVYERFRDRRINLAAEIRRLIKLGMSNKEIADTLGVSYGYVNLIKYKMLKKKR